MLRYNHVPLLFSLLSSGLGFMASSESKAATVTADKVYQIVSRYSGKCLDVTDHSNAEGVQLQQWNCTSKPNQKFKVIAGIKGAVFLKAQESGLYVKVANESLDNGGAVVQSNNNSGNAPRLLLTAHGEDFTIKFANSGKCLDLDGPSANAGARIHQWDCHGGSSQDWTFVEQTEGLGAQAWSLGNTSVIADSFGRIFRLASPNANNVLVSVDKNTGRDRWSFQATSYANMVTSCNEADRIFVNDQNNLTALNPNNGQVLWNFNGGSGDTGTNLSCVPGYNSVFFAASSQNGKFRSIEKATGNQRWEYTPNGYASYLGKKGQNVFLQVYKDAGQTLVNLESGTGRVKWTRAINSSNGEWVFATAVGDIFINRSTQIQKLNPENGSTLWSYSAENKAEFYMEYNDAGIVYVTRAQEVRRLNSDNGSILWTYNMPKSEGSIDSLRNVLKNGEVLIRTQDHSNDHVHTVLLAIDGRKIWENDTTNGYSSLTEDASGKLFLTAGRNISSIDRATGKVRWTFAREFPRNNEAIFRVETYGADVYVLYGEPTGKYPPMGILRLDAASAALQWDVWTGEPTSLIGSSDGLLFTNRVMNSGTIAYRR